MRADGRRPDELRPLTFRRRYTRTAPGSVLVRMGRTTVISTCCIELDVRFINSPPMPEFGVCRVAVDISTAHRAEGEG